MLSAENRLRRRADFAEVVRSGQRLSRRLVTVHVLRTDQPHPPQAGLVVGRKVGASVVRSRVSRRLRSQLRPLLPLLPTGTRLVVRASPAAAAADSAALGRDLQSAIGRCFPGASALR